MREVVFGSADFDLFDQDISPSDYEFFKKHTGAFKRMLEDQSREKKKEFVEKFKTFALTHGCLKGCPSKNDNRHYLDGAIAQYNENFVNGKLSSAKSIVMDAVILAQNRHNLQYMGANSYSKDPFFHKETRDTFRRLFGQPSEKGTCLKVVCVLPLHIKFGGSICRYLRRWLEADDIEPVVAQVKIFTKRDEAKRERMTPAQKREDDKKRLDMEEFDYQFRKLLDYHPRNYGFDDFLPLASFGHKLSKMTNSSTGSDTKASEAQNDTPKDEGLSLSEYLGISKKKKEDTAVQKVKLYAKAFDSMKPKDEGLGGKESDKTPMSSSDKNYEEVRKMFVLGKPHPNVEFEQINKKSLSKEDTKRLKNCKEYIRKAQKAELENDRSLKREQWGPDAVLGEGGKKRHACAFCRVVEPEARQFKKCQKCHGKRTRFYCSKKCQEEDWVLVHREEHTDSIEDVT